MRVMEETLHSRDWVPSCALARGHCLSLPCLGFPIPSKDFATSWLLGSWVDRVGVLRKLQRVYVCACTGVSGFAR